MLGIPLNIITDRKLFLSLFVIDRNVPISNSFYTTDLLQSGIEKP